jgi:multimeric flavodoxin WrbA
VHIVIHDLYDELFYTLAFKDEIIEVNAKNKAAPCQGCFKCWRKNAGYCVTKDSLQHIGAAIGTSDKITIISEISYGGYSSSIKRVIDRSIGFSIPFFIYREWKTHHMKRYRHSHQMLSVYFYGQASEFEKETAKELVKMNSINMGIKEVRIAFVDTAEELGGRAL